MHRHSLKDSTRTTNQLLPPNPTAAAAITSRCFNATCTLALLNRAARQPGSAARTAS